MVNRMFPGPLIPAAPPPDLSISFYGLPEWRLVMITLFAARYDSETARAIEAAVRPVRAIVDQVLLDADVSRGIGLDSFRRLETVIRELMDAQARKRIPRTIQNQESH
jgi:hypothetical protein